MKNKITPEDFGIYIGILMLFSPVIALILYFVLYYFYN